MEIEVFRQVNQSDTRDVRPPLPRLPVSLQFPSPIVTLNRDLQSILNHEDDRERFPFSVTLVSPSPRLPFSAPLPATPHAPRASASAHAVESVPEPDRPGHLRSAPSLPNVRAVRTSAPRWRSPDEPSYCGKSDRSRGRGENRRFVHSPGASNNRSGRFRRPQTRRQIPVPRARERQTAHRTSLFAPTPKSLPHLGQSGALDYKTQRRSRSPASRHLSEQAVPISRLKIFEKWPE